MNGLQNNDLRPSLKAYQSKAIDHLLLNKHTAVFYEQGLGKTRIILEEINRCKNLDFIVIVCPKTLIPTWIYQIELWSHPFYDINIVKGIGDFESGKYILNIVSVDFFSRKKDLSQLCEKLESDNSYIVIDESSTIKNMKSARTKNIVKISRRCNGKRRLLNGMPITQTPFDLFSQMAFIDTNVFEQKSIWAFQNYYGITRFRHLTPFTGFNEVVGYKNMDELMGRTKKFSISMTKKDAAPELPDKIYQKIPVEMVSDQASMYKRLLDECLIAVNNDEDIAVIDALPQLMKLRQILSGFVYFENDNGEKGFIETGNCKLELLSDLISFNDKKNIIVWCTFIKEVEIISRHLHKLKIEHRAIHSYVPIELVDDYTSGKVSVLVITQRKGGLGLTLTNTDIAIFFSNSYSVAGRMQAEDRCHRIGLDHPVLYYDLIVKNSIDENLYKVLTETKNFNLTLREWLL